MSKKDKQGLSGKSFNEEDSGMNRMGLSIMSRARRQVLEDSDEEPVTKIQEEYQKNKQKYDEFNEKNIYERKKQRTAKLEHKEYENIDSDDCKHNAAVFEYMKYQQRKRHITNLWLLTYKKAKAGSIMLMFLGNISKKIQLLGIQKGIEDKTGLKKIPRYIIQPKDPFKQIWNVIIMILLAYTATYMPYKTCFVDDSTVLADTVDWTVDVLFMVDIVINFLSAFETEKETLIEENHNNRYVTDPKLIAKTYLKSWFTFDLISVLPFSLFEKLVPQPDAASGGSQGYNQLVRLARLPRLYRMTKLIRLLRIIKQATKMRYLRQLLKRLSTNAAISRQIRFSFTAILMTHIFACFWFLTAKFMDYHPDTWVYREGLANAPPSSQYLYSLYWATQTVTTVGYGDISAKTTPEIILSFVWMMVGVAFYSFIIGNFSSIISGNSQDMLTIQNRVQGLSDLARKAQIPFNTSKKIKQYIENNSHSLFSQEEEDKLIKMLPPYLRDDILNITYGEILDKVAFFREVGDADFLWQTLPILHKIKLKKGDILYWKGDGADQIFFILNGRVKLYSDGHPFIQYRQGEMFGDSDALLDLPRDGKAIAMTHLNLMALSVVQFEDVAATAKETCLKMIVNARRTRDKHLHLIAKMQERKRRKTVLYMAQQEGLDCKTIQMAQSSLQQQPVFGSGLIQMADKMTSSQKLQSSVLSSQVSGKSQQFQQMLEPPTAKSAGDVIKNLNNFGNQMDEIQEENSQMTDRNSDQIFQSNKKLQKSSSVHSKSFEVRSERNSFRGDVGSTKHQRKSTIMTNDKSDFTFTSKILNPTSSTFKKLKQQRSGTQKRIIMSRRATLLDSRLTNLMAKNDNANNAVQDDQVLPKTLLQKFWLNSVPIIGLGEDQKKAKVKQADNDEEQISKRRGPKSSKSRGGKSHLSKGTRQSKKSKGQKSDKEINSQSKKSDQKLSEAMKIIVLPPDQDINASQRSIEPQEQNEPSSKLVVKTRERSLSDAKESPFFKPKLRRGSFSSGFTNIPTIVQTSAARKEEQSSMGNIPSTDIQTFQNLQSPVSTPTLPGPLGSGLRRGLTRQGSFLDGTVTRQGSFIEGNNTTMNSVESKLTNMKDIHGDKARALISQRLKKQSQDQLGRLRTFIDHNKNLEKKDDIFGKSSVMPIAEELEEDEEEEQAWDSKAPRRTLLDRVVGNIFGTKKEQLYEIYPELAVITVPKMPIITPKGDEIIHRNKFKTQLQLLDHAFNQKKRLEEDEEQKNQQKAADDLDDFMAKIDKELLGSKNQIDVPEKRMGLFRGKSESLFIPKKLLPSGFKRDKTLRNLASGDSISIQVQNVDQSNEMKNIAANHLRSSSKSSDKTGSNEINRRKSSDVKEYSPLKESEKVKSNFVSSEVFDKLKTLQKEVVVNKIDIPEESKKQTKEPHSSLKKKWLNDKSPTFMEQGIKAESRFIPADTSPIQLNSSARNRQTDPRLCSSISISADSFFDETIQSSARSLFEDPQQHKARVEILQALKIHLANSEQADIKIAEDQLQLASHRSSKRSSKPQTSDRAIVKPDPQAPVQFLGEKSLKSIVQFNGDSHLLALNSFEVLSTFDQVSDAQKGIKEKMKKIGKTNQEIGQRQVQVDQDVDIMAVQLQAYINMKKEVDIMKQFTRNKNMKSKSTRAASLTTDFNQRNVRSVPENTQEQIQYGTNLQLGQPQDMKL